MIKRWVKITLTIVLALTGSVIISSNSIHASSIRPNAYHFRPQTGFLNDVQTIIHDGNHWDIYYLLNPDKRDNNGTTQWNLATTSDFKHFTDHGLAISRNQGSWGSVGAGAVIANNQNGHLIDNRFDSNAKLVYFVSYTNGHQNIYEAVSKDDGTTFQPTAGDSIVLPAPVGMQTFRDPSVRYDSQTHRLMMYVTAGQGPYGGTQINTYSSTDGYHFNQVSNSGSFGQVFTNDAPSNVEYPNVFSTVYDQGTHQNVAVEFFSGNGGPQGDSSFYQLGKIRPDGSFQGTSIYKRLDAAFDNYAANFAPLTSDDHNLIMMGWVGNWNRHYSNFMKQTNDYDLGFMALPRRLTLVNGTFQAQIIAKKGLNPRLKKHVKRLTLKGSQLASTIDVKTSSNNQIQFLQPHSRTVLTINRNHIEWTQPRSPLKGTATSDTLFDKPVHHVIFYLDHNSIEAAFPESGQTATILNYSGDNQMTITSKRKINVTMRSMNN